MLNMLAELKTFCRPLEKELLQPTDSLDWEDFMTHQEYKNWASENGGATLKLEVVVTLHVEEEPEAPVLVTLSPDLTSFIQRIMEDKETADFSLRCPTKTFRVHRTFLCTR